MPPVNFLARFDSECGVCEKKIREGAEVTWRDEEVVHAECAFSPTKADVLAICGECFMAKSVTGACGCVG